MNKNTRPIRGIHRFLILIPVSGFLSYTNGDIKRSYTKLGGNILAIYHMIAGLALLVAMYAVK